MGLLKKMKINYDNKVQYTAILHKYALLKKALHNKIVYPVDKKYWEECINIYELNLKRGNKDTNNSQLIVMKEEYQLYLELLKEKENK